MGIAEATAFDEGGPLSVGGDGEMPVGEAMEDGNM